MLEYWNWMVIIIIASDLCPPNTGPPVAACSPVQSCPLGTICHMISGFCCGLAVEPLQPLLPPVVPALPVPVIQSQQQQQFQRPISVLQQNLFPIGQEQQQQEHIVIMCPSKLFCSKINLIN